MQWYFLSDTQEQIPIQENHITDLVQTGVVKANTMIWKEGMDEWGKCSEIKPELFAQRNVVPIVGDVATARQTAALHAQGQAQEASAYAPPATTEMQLGDGQTVREAAQAIASASVWMKMIAILTIIVGIVELGQALFYIGASVTSGNAMPIVLILLSIGAMMAVILISAGQSLFQSATAAREAAINAQKRLLLSALSDLTRFYRLTGMLMLIGIVISLISVALVFFMFGNLLLG